MNEILLQDLLKFDKEQIKSAKAKFNICTEWENPMDVFLRNKDEINTKWLFWRQERRYFEVGQIAICFLLLGNNNWLLTTIKKVTSELGETEGVNYTGEELTEYSQYFGRVIVKFHKQRSQIYWYEGISKDMIVQQILPAVYDGIDFPGYDNVRIPYEQLKLIVDRRKTDWINALGNQKAVYLITDRSTGKMYVGSATSANGMLLARWSAYVANGHGGNVELSKVVEEKGMDYIKANFTYSILENYNSRVDDSIILAREVWWKDTLQTRRYGYNAN